MVSGDQMVCGKGSEDKCVGREAVIVGRPMLAMRMWEVSQQSVDWMETSIRCSVTCAMASFK